MRIIYRYKLKTEDHKISLCSLTMPEGSIVLSAGSHCGDVCLWTNVDAADPTPMETRVFVAIPSGVLFAAGEYGSLTFIGSVILDSWEAVYHVFEVRKISTRKVVGL